METFTFLFTDIEGSTVLVRRLGEGLYAQLLADHHALIRSGLAAHAGQEVGTQGDGFFAVFSSPRACVAAAVEMQRSLAAHAWPGGEQVRVRMGVHTGEASKTAAGVVGVEVHRAARVTAVGYGGQVLLSETAAALVRDALPPGAALEDLGVHRLKDLSGPERIFQLQAPGLQARFPPLRSLGNPALCNNLPAQPAAFIGRRRELAEVRALVESSRLVTLTGAGGCGKTRLGVQLAAELLDGFGDGVWLVELAAVSAEDAVASAIFGALRIAGQPGRSALEALLDALALQDVLIVLDNCEHLIGACAKIADAIVRRCPRVRLVATSREPLGIGGEAIYRVPPLSLPGPGDASALAVESSDAIALFVDRARAQGAALSISAETGPLVVLICRQLDGLPLAIELAAARLRSLSLADLYARLGQRFRLLTGGDRTALPRQQTLRATVDWSYSLLHGAEQLLLRRLPVFAESFDLAAAEVVCGFGDLQQPDIISLLGSLVDKSLVVAEPTGPGLRYRLLETIRQFAVERLTEAGEPEATTVQAAHCAHFLDVAETAASHLTRSEQGTWLARLDADQANLRRAAGHAARGPDGTGQVLRLGVALKRYWITRTRGEEALRLLAPVLDRPEARADPELFAAALVTAALAARGVDITAALRLGEQAVNLARELGDGPVLIASLAALSSVYYHAGEAERGLAPGWEAVERARQLGHDVLRGESLVSYLWCDALIDPAHAEPLFAEAIACTQRSGDHFHANDLTKYAAVQALNSGDIPAARAYLQQAIQTMREIGDKGSNVSINMGWVLRQDSDPDGARTSFEEALRLNRRNGALIGIAYASLGLACLAADKGDWQRAAALHGTAQAILDRSGQPWEELEARYRHDSLGQVRAHLGQQQFEHTYAKGMALSLDEALNLISTKTPADLPVT